MVKIFLINLDCKKINQAKTIILRIDLLKRSNSENKKKSKPKIL
jgi:hypothetical protein